MIPKRDQPWFEFTVVLPTGDEFREALPAETIREATDKMRRVYPEARLTMERHFKKEDEPATPPPPRVESSSEPPATPKPPADDFRSVLGVEADADFATMQKAYREALKRYHPDRVAGLGEEFVTLAEQKTREYNAAFKAAKKHFGK
ncbi:MAG: J domain-containing protein [Puniceicoccales bacterium]